MLKTILKWFGLGSKPTIYKGKLTSMRLKISTGPDFDTSVDEVLFVGKDFNTVIASIINTLKESTVTDRDEQQHPDYNDYVWFVIKDLNQINKEQSFWVTQFHGDFVITVGSVSENIQLCGGIDVVD